MNRERSIRIASCFPIWNDSRIQQPEHTGHDYTDHGAKNGYSSWVKKDMDEQLAAFRKAQGIADGGVLSPAQQKQFAEEFAARIRSMPPDTLIGGFRDAVQRGGAAAVRAWKAARLAKAAEGVMASKAAKIAALGAKKSAKVVAGAIPIISIGVSLWDFPKRAGTYGGLVAAGMTVLDNVPLADIALGVSEATDEIQDAKRKADMEAEREMQRLRDELG